MDAEIARNDVRKKNKQENSISMLKILMNEGKECIKVYFRGVEF